MSKKIDLKSLSATNLRIILLVTITGLLVGQVGLIVAGQGIIRSFSQPVADAVARSNSSQQTLRDLETAKVILDKQTDTFEKSSLIAADTTNTYLYQKTIIDDISAYAARAGLNPSSYTFSGAEGEGDSAGAAVPAAPTPAADAEPAGGGAAAVASTTTVTVAFDGNITYGSLFSFLQLLEGSLLRMEIDSLSLSRSSAATETEGDTPADRLDISSLNIKVHTQ